MIACIDLFCGLGGLTHGLSCGGVRVVAGVDMDYQCRFPYEANNPARFIEADVRDLTGKAIRQLWGRSTYTLLAGCAPCQPFSTYGRASRRQRCDNKWDLVSDFGRLIRESEPDFVTMENVPQLVDHAVFANFLSLLDGYQVWWKVVECAQYGIPQTRRRLVLLASRLGEISLISPSLIDEQRATVRHAISHLPPIPAGGSDPRDALHSAPALSALNMRRIRASKPGGTWRDWDEKLKARCHLKSSGKTYPSVYGRMEWDAPAPTMTTQCFGYGNGRFGHPKQNRAISLREAALIQTFPDSYKFLKDGERVRFNILGRLIGNAVPVRLGEVVAESLVAHLSSQSTQRLTKH